MIADLVYIEKEFSTANGFILTYEDLMKDLALTADGKNYPTYTEIEYDEDGVAQNVLTDEEESINNAIKSIQSFNVGVYYAVQKRNEITHRLDVTNIDSHNYSHILINSYYADRPTEKEYDESGHIVTDPDSISSNRILTSVGSILFTNTPSLDIVIDSKFKQLNEAGRPMLDDNNKPVLGDISAGDYFYLYLLIETIDNRQAELYYKFIYKPIVMDEDNQDTPDDNSDSNNEMNVFNPIEDGDDLTNSPMEFDNFILSDSRWEDYVFINTVSVSQLNQLPNRTLTLYSRVARVYVSPLCPTEFTFTFTVTIRSKTKVYTFNYKPKTIAVTSPTSDRCIKMSNPDVSYELLRTNPKLTGNIKVVVDSNDNIYLDTFKVSDTLSNRKYRHIKVGYDSYYGSSVMKFFKDMNSSDLYKVEPKCYNLVTTVQTVNEQYYDTYRMGVKTNDDKLYSENYALLAPLCVKRIVPDFFLIFKVDKHLREKMLDAYDEAKFTDKEKLQYFLKYGTIIKVFDMRQNSKLGTYIRTIYKHSSEVAGDLYESYDADNLNKFNGISVDRGVVSTMYESGYKEEQVSNQVALNDFYTQGFERNRLVSKDIINFEFMFNDESADLFSLNTYFGLYVRVNTQDEDFACIGRDSSGNFTFDTKVYSFNPGVKLNNTQFSTILYGLTTPKSFYRLNTGVFDSKYIKDYMLKPYKSIETFHVKELNASYINNFITLTLNSPLEVGEHIRVIDVPNKTIYEVIVCDRKVAAECDGYYTDENDLSEIITNYFNELGSAFTIKRIGLYTYYRDNYEELAKSFSMTMAAFTEMVKLQQAKQLYQAFRKFYQELDAPVTSYKISGSNLSLVGYSKSLLFERICSPSIFDDVMKNYVRTTEDENNAMTFYGGYQAHKTILEVNDVDSSITGIAYWKTKKYAYLYPIHFEFSGTRIAYILPFLNTEDLSSDGKLYSCKIEKPDDIFNNRTVLYYSKTPLNDEVQTNIVDKISINYFTNSDDLSQIYRCEKKLNYIMSYQNLDEKIIRLSEPIINNKAITLYTPYMLNSGPCSIFNIKDFDFDVIDSSTYINSIVGTTNVLTTKSTYSSRSFFEHSYSQPSMYDMSIEDVPNYELQRNFIELKDNFTKEQNKLKSYYDGSVLTGHVAWDPSINANSDSFMEYIPKRGTDDQEDKLFYIVVHCTLEEFNERLKTNLFDKIPVDNIIPYSSRRIYQTLCNLTHNDDATYPYNIVSGFILRPYLGDSMAYNTLYAYYNYVIPSAYDFGISYLNWIENDENPQESYGEWPGKASVVYPSANDLFYPFEEKEYSSTMFFEEKNDYYKSDMPLLKGQEENFKNYIDKFDTYSFDTSTLTLTGASTSSTNRSKYLKHLYSDNHKSFDISLVSPHVCKWKSTGTDARIEDLRLLYKPLNPPQYNSSFYIVDSSSFNSYLGVLYLKERNTTSYSILNEKYPKNFLNSDFPKYINRTLDDIILDKNNDASLGTEELDYILYKNGCIDDILYDSLNTKCKFSIVHSAGTNTLEFVSGGIKFKLSSNNVNILNLDKYKGYSACFVNIPTHSKNGKNTEIIIDETRHEMLLIWYSNTNTNMYGIKYHFNSNNEAEETDAMNGLIMTKINYMGTIEDIETASMMVNGQYSYQEQKLHGAKSIDIIKLEDTMGFSGVINKNTNLSENLGASNTFERNGRKLCSSTGYLYISNIGVDNNSYSKKHPVAIVGSLTNSTLLTDNIIYSENFSYYDKSGNVIGYTPYIWHDNRYGQHNYHDLLTSDTFDKYVYNYPNNYDTLLYTDDIDCITSSIRNYDALVRALKSCGMFIKTSYGVYDYSTKTELFTLSVEEPIKYSRYKNYKYGITENTKYTQDYELSVLPTFAEPVMKNMLEFEYNTTGINSNFNENDSQDEQVRMTRSLEKVFNKSFDGANIFIKNVNRINQIWYNKYTKIPNYCIINSLSTGVIDYMLMSVHFDSNISILGDSWINTQYKEYFHPLYSNTVPQESCLNINGYETGYELKTFLNSKAVSLNAKEIILSTWKNVDVDANNNLIKIDITESLINHILTNSAFLKSWRHVDGVTNEMKTKYIKNYILNFININNKSKFILRRSDLQYKSLRFDSIYDEEMIECKNFKNELKQENGKYYMYVYPEGKHAYYAKMIITL